MNWREQYSMMYVILLRYTELLQPSVKRDRIASHWRTRSRVSKTHEWTICAMTCDLATPYLCCDPLSLPEHPRIDPN